MNEATISLGYLPLSFNLTAHAHWRTTHAAKQRLQRDLEIVLLGVRDMPRDRSDLFVAVSATLLVPDCRRRDEGNFRTPLEKALGDALVNGRWLPDDTPQHYRFDGLAFEYVQGVSASRLHLCWGEVADAGSARANAATLPS